jgi:hypothetical protein
MSSPSSDPSVVPSAAPVPATAPTVAGRGRRALLLLPHLLPAAARLPLCAAAWVPRAVMRLVVALRQVEADKDVKLKQIEATAQIAACTLAVKHEIAAKALEKEGASTELAEVLRALDPAACPPPLPPGDAR